MREGLSSHASGPVRPGAMTTAMRAARRDPRPEQNALRVAIARAGRIDREWVLESGEVTFGRSEVADVVIADHVEREATLLGIDDGVMTLNVPAGASGRLALDGVAIDLATMASRAITLETGARGRIVLAGAGEEAIAVLFQRVVAPEKRNRPVLPAVVRGGLFQRVDWLFTALAAASFMAHLTFVVGLSNSDWPVQNVAVIEDRYAETIFSPVIEPPMPTIEDPTQPSDPTTPSDRTTPTSDPAPTGPARPHTPPTPRPAQSDPDAQIAATEAIRQATLMLTGANGIGGSLTDLLRNGAPTDHADVIFAQVDGASPIAAVDHIATRTGAPVGDPGFGLHSLATTPGERPEGDHGVTETGPHRPHIDLRPTDDPPDTAVFDDALLRRALRARMSAIQQCYEHELTRSPGLAGRISLSMQVERIGTLSHVEAVDDNLNARSLTDCVINNVRTIRLVTGPTEPVTVEYPIVFAPQS